MKKDEAISLIRADNDQHKAAMRDWFNEADWSDILTFWFRLQDQFDDKFTEQMSLVAACQFADLMVERYERETLPPVDG